MVLKMAPNVVNPGGFTDPFLVLAQVPCRQKVYFLVLGPGNIRWGTNAEELNTSPAPGINNGLPQNAATGEKEREWVGDIYAISDTANTSVVVVCPGMDADFRLGQG